MPAFFPAALLALAGAGALNGDVLPQQGQRSSPSAATAALATPSWTKRLQLKDGRSFVTDGALAVDAALANPPVLPALIPATLDRFLEAPFEHEYRATELTAGRRSYVTPNGVALNRTYVDYLKRIVAPNKLRFRVASPGNAVVVAVEGKPIAVLMPMAR